MGTRVKLTIRNKVTSRGKRLLELAEKKVKVDIGIFDQKLAQIGSYHEFGTANIPRRSFLRAWMTEDGRVVMTDLRKALEAVWEGRSPKSSLDEVGKKAVAGIQGRIMKKIPPQLAASTIAQKSGANRLVPLIDRGSLFRAITFRIVED